jgi:hypothetical protein
MQLFHSSNQAAMGVKGKVVPIRPLLYQNSRTVKVTRTLPQANRESLGTHAQCIPQHMAVTASVHLELPATSVPHAGAAARVAKVQTWAR